MKKIIYVGNKEEQTIMRVGRIKKGIPKEVTDEVATDLVDGKNYTYYVEFEPPIVINSPRYEPPASITESPRMVQPVICTAVIEKEKLQEPDLMINPTEKKDDFIGKVKRKWDKKR